MKLRLFKSHGLQFGGIRSGEPANFARNEKLIRGLLRGCARIKINWSGFYKTVTIALAAQAILCG
jgi:hypothetical protein